MTLSIHIEAHPDRGDMGQQMEQAMAALGFHRISHKGRVILDQHVEPDNAVDDVSFVSHTVQQPETILTNTPRAGESEAQTAARRERGKPSPGRARRTKEEIAEDEAADAADAAKQQAAEEADLKDDVKLAVSTGEERVGPDDVQDAADEAAETEKTGLASIDVLRRLVGDYQKKHGMPAAVKLCQEGGLIGKPIHELDDAGIEAAIAAMQGGGKVPTEEIPYEIGPDGIRRPSHGPGSDVKEPAKLDPKTKADLIEAMMRYADKYDGTRDQAKMVHTLADMPKVFVETFGEGVDKLSKVPEDKYAEAVAAVEAAIEADPYGRAK